MLTTLFAGPKLFLSPNKVFCSCLLKHQGKNYTFLPIVMQVKVEDNWQMEKQKC